MVTSIVSMLMEGGMNGFDPSSSLTLEESRKYTLESGAALIARESVQELHEIFEVSIIQTNEAVLGAYMEGTSDVMESITYGPIFEASEKKAGEKILDFLRKLKDRVFAFFADIFSRLTALVNDYDKFFNKKKEDMQKAEKERGSGVHGVKVKAWNDKLIDSLDDRLQECTKHIDSVANDCIKAINEFHDSANSKNSDGTDKSSKAVNYIMGKFNQRMEEILNETSHKTLGIGTGKETSNIDTTKIHEYCQLMFTGGDNERTEEITVSYVEHNLVGTKKAASKVKESQKAFNKAYDDAIKKIKKITADMENKDAKGYSQYIHKATATMSKIQTLVNAYATSGYRALIGRANESKALCGVIISGKAGKRKAD